MPSKMSPCSDPVPIGPLESEILKVMWRIGQATVGEVLVALPRRLPYTTVMSAMVKLVEKGVLERTVVEVPFHYKPCFSPEQFQREKMRRFISSFPSGPTAGLDALQSSVIDHFGHDVAFLDELQSRFHRRRRPLARRRAEGTK
jgi:predicted transcriptional regulator